MRNIMAIPALAVTLFSLIVCLKNHKSLLYPGVIFNFIWSFAIIANQINLNEFYPVNEITYFVILVGVVAFNVPFLMAKSKNAMKPSMVSCIDTKKIKWIILIQIILIMVLIPLAIKAIPFYNIYGSSAFRTIYAKSVEYGYMSSVERMFYIHYGVFPLSLITNITMIFLWTNGSVKFKFLLVGFISEGLISFCSGGRGNILILLLSLIQAVYLSDKLSTEFVYYMNKIKRQVKWVIFILIMVLAYISIQRGNVGEGNFIFEFTKTITANYSGGIQLFDLSLRDPEEWGLYDFCLGTASLNGFIQILLLFIRIISLNRINITIPSVTAYAGNFFNVSPSQTMNAYVTVFYTFIQDFGYLGVVILPLIIGRIFVRIYKRTKNYPDLYNMMMLSYINIVLLFSTIRWRLMLSDWAMMVVYIYIICRFLEGKQFKSRIKMR